MKRQTLEEAVLRARSGKHRDLARAAHVLHGKPVGGWADTEQAIRQLRDFLPLRLARSYTSDEFIEKIYDSSSGIYRVRKVDQTND